jgi:hypothetical protein
MVSVFRSTKGASALRGCTLQKFSTQALLHGTVYELKRPLSMCQGIGLYLYDLCHLLICDARELIATPTYRQGAYEEK